ncbi:hypothetical protein PROFUN_09335 [Planoprotostelium fungivorum]|uniref:Uncharacterized protein n=1 Tax=Planoprotostelium fungivorum TaxID=1890364 RepID=A0A2P6NHD7_9EUKA|nr:hypothetical protein PROFUN_13112 [Planoprotostelium fungivorum]PRP83354.1 hypothetical protein PROFUN_09335 [Planoprotostelium fungivorum]
MLKITPENVFKFKTAKVFKDNEKRINSIDISSDGELLLTSSDDESLQLYNTQTGKHLKTVYARRNGVDQAIFTHARETVLVASSSGWDHSIRYLSLYDNRYLRYFKGHRDKVNSISLCPKSDLFLSSSNDGTVRLWDLNTNVCQGLMSSPRFKPGRVAFDTEGLIFAVAGSMSTIKLFDVQLYQRGPFASFTVPSKGLSFDWTRIEFSNDGKMMLLSTSNQIILILNAYNGDVMQTLRAPGVLADEATFTPDGQFVLCGSLDGTIYCWSSSSGQILHQWKQGTKGVGPIRWNPMTMMFASADTSLYFWLPDVQPHE